MSSKTSVRAAESFTIQQVARLTGLSEHTLRYYEKVGLIEPVGRDSSSRHRRYSAGELARIESLAHLRAVGLGIEDMRTMMHSRGNGSASIDTKIALLIGHKRRLDSKIASLRARRRFLGNRIAYWQAVRAKDQDATVRTTAEGDILSRRLS